MREKNIYVIGACQGAGATFIATSLAFSMAIHVDGVAFVESPKTNVIKEEALVINKLTLEKLKSKKTKEYNNIFWCVYEKSKEFSERDFHKKFLEDKDFRYIIYDSPAEYRNCDLIICIIDSLPSNVIASSKVAGHLRTYFSNRIIWILNRDILSNSRAIEKHLGIKFDFKIPMENQESIYKAEQYGKPLQNSTLMNKEVEKSIENIAKYIISLF